MDSCLPKLSAYSLEESPSYINNVCLHIIDVGRCAHAIFSQHSLLFSNFHINLIFVILCFATHHSESDIKLHKLILHVSSKWAVWVIFCKFFDFVRNAHLISSSFNIWCIFIDPKLKIPSLSGAGTWHGTFLTSAWKYDCFHLMMRKKYISTSCFGKLIITKYLFQ